LDGGIDATTAGQGVAAAAGILVAGTAIFRDTAGVATAMNRWWEAAGFPVDEQK